MQNSKYAVKLKTKKAVDKIKNGSNYNRVQEMLRKRFRDQLRNKRAQLFELHRPGLIDANNESMYGTLTDILRKEMNDLSTLDLRNNEDLWSPSQEDLIQMEEEILEEEEQWIMTEFENMQQLESEMAEKYLEDLFKDQVICPICEKESIKEIPGGLLCPGCDFGLSKISIDEFRIGLQRQIDIHNEKCMSQPRFSSVSENGTHSLYLTCDTCYFMGLIR